MSCQTVRNLFFLLWLAPDFSFCPVRDSSVSISVLEIIAKESASQRAIAQSLSLLLTEQWQVHSWAKLQQLPLWRTLHILICLLLFQLWFPFDFLIAPFKNLTQTSSISEECGVHIWGRQSPGRDSGKDKFESLEKPTSLFFLIRKIDTESGQYFEPCPAFEQFWMLLRVSATFCSIPWLLAHKSGSFYHTLLIRY